MTDEFYELVEQFVDLENQILMNIQGEFDPEAHKEMNLEQDVIKAKMCHHFDKHIRK